MLEQITVQEMLFVSGFVLTLALLIDALECLPSALRACDVCKTKTDLFIYSIRTDRKGKRICDECQRDESKEFERAQVTYFTTRHVMPGYEWFERTE